MGLFRYTIKVTCDNCGMVNDLSVKKGLKVKDFVKTAECKCRNCGAYINVKEYSTEWFK